MKRLAILAAAGLIGFLPNIASARSRFSFGFNFGIPFFGLGFYQPTYPSYSYAPVYSYSYASPPVVYAAPPVTYYAQPQAVYAPPVYNNRYPSYYYSYTYCAPAPRYYGGGSYYYYYRH